MADRSGADELDAECRTHHAVGAVAPDHIISRKALAHASRKINNTSHDTGLGMLEVLEPVPVQQFHRCKRARKTSQNRVEPNLRADLKARRAERFRLGAVAGRPWHAAELVTGKVRDEHDIHRVVRREWTVLYGFGNAPAPAEFHGPDVHLVHFRGRNRAVSLLNERAGNAAPAELDRERKTHRAASDNQHRGLGIHGLNTPAHPLRNVSAQHLTMGRMAGSTPWRADAHLDVLPCNPHITRRRSSTKAGSACRFDR